jgi:uncharacterized protein YqeY
LKARLEEDTRRAMKAQDVVRRETLRLCLSAIHNEEVARRAELDDDAVLAVLGKQAKMRRESIEAFTKGARQELADKEAAELAVIESYLPKQASDDDIRAAARRIIGETGAAGPRAQGQVMPKLMAELKGTADGKRVAAIVGELLKA